MCRRRDCLQNERGPAKWTIQNERGPAKWTIQNKATFYKGGFFILQERKM